MKNERPDRVDLRKKRMATDNHHNQEPTKEELQRQMEVSRDQLAKTVGEIKETVEEQYVAAKETITGVLDYREQFSKEPLVWSLGAVSAGFALGYTMGYAHKRSKGKKHSEIAAFADSLVEELSTVGTSMVMPSLNQKIEKLFGFNFSELLEEIGHDKKRGRRNPTKALPRKKRATVKKTKLKSSANHHTPIKRRTAKA